MTTYPNLRQCWPGQARLQEKAARLIAGNEAVDRIHSRKLCFILCANVRRDNEWIHICGVDLRGRDGDVYYVQAQRCDKQGLASVRVAAVITPTRRDIVVRFAISTSADTFDL